MHEHGLVGDEMAGQTQLGKRGAGRHAFLEDRPRLDVGVGREGRQIVVGVLGVQHWISRLHDAYVGKT